MVSEGLFAKNNEYQSSGSLIVEIRNKISDIPTEPGVYKFRDSKSRVIYVGKAKKLRQRLSSYFVEPQLLHPRTKHMVATALTVEWTIVTTEVEALQLEYSWIKQFDPPYNVRYKDDKSFPFLSVSTQQTYPRFGVFRGQKRKNMRYFGPYTHVWAIRETLELIRGVFPVRTCSDAVFKQHSDRGRPCLLGYIDKCSAPCVGRISPEEYRQLVDQTCLFLSGKTENFVSQLQNNMNDAAELLDYEKAAHLRDDMRALQKALEKQHVVLDASANLDVVGTSADDLEVAIEIFTIRQGRIVGQQGWVVPLTADYDLDEDTQKTENSAEQGYFASRLKAQIADFLTQYYQNLHELDMALEQVEKKVHEENYMVSDSTRGFFVGAHNSKNPAQTFDRHSVLGTTSVPDEIIISVVPNNVAEVISILTMISSRKVQVRKPQRGEKKRILEMVEKNAHNHRERHKLRRSRDITTRSLALNALAEYIGLSSGLLRIECIDISHLQGTNVVASCVVFEDGLPKKSDYRKYMIKYAAGEGKSNDVASISEIVTRRSQKYGDASNNYPVPDLLVVDGGLPQVNAAFTALQQNEMGQIPVIGLAKRLEEVWIPYEPYPIILPRQSEALFLLQHLRDESHRVAIEYQRKKRNAAVRVSELDALDGIGHVKKKALLRHFGSVTEIKKATVEQIIGVEGFGEKSAQKLYENLHER